MMEGKGSSPFFPGQPVPPEMFTGRVDQIELLMSRGASQISTGKPVAVFVEGEYGIGKSSIAKFVSWVAEERYGILPIYASIGGTKSIDDVAAAIMEATIRTGVFDPTRKEKVRNWVGDYVGHQSLFGLNVNLQAIKRDAPALASPYGILGFLEEAAERLGKGRSSGVFLILDEINGITQYPEFAHFVKGLIDTNAMNKAPLPLLLMLCGVTDRRREMIQKHPPVDRIFDIIAIKPLQRDEVVDFFAKAFSFASIEVEPSVLDAFAYYSAGFPKLMHEIGDVAYWHDKDGKIDLDESFDIILATAEVVLQKYVDSQILGAIRSEDYRAILSTIAALSPMSMEFTRAEVAQHLTPTQQTKLTSCLKRMRDLGVFRLSETHGTYEWVNRMVRLSLWLVTLRNNSELVNRLSPYDEEDELLDPITDSSQ